MEWLCEHHVDSLHVAQWLSAWVPSHCFESGAMSRGFPSCSTGLYGLSRYILVLSTCMELQSHSQKVTQPGGGPRQRGRCTGTCVHIPAIPSWLSILHETYNSPSEADSVLHCMMSLCSCTVLMSLPLASTCTGPPGFACCNIPTADVTVQAMNQPGSNMPSASSDECLTSCTSSPLQSLIPAPISCLLAEHRLQSYKHLPLSTL